MSFRQFGGMNYAAKHNIVGSNYNTSNNLLVTQNVGQSNSYINFLSDISGNINFYGDLDLSGNINVYGDLDLSGNLNVSGDIDCSGNINVYGDLDLSGNLNVSGDIDCSGNINVYGDVDLSGNLNVSGDIDCSGNINVSGISVNTLEVINQIELTPTGNVINFVGEINQVAIGLTFNGNQLQPTAINSNSGQSSAVALTICDNVGGEGLEILPNATNNAKNPIVQTGDIVIAASSTTQSLAITCDSTTTNGVRITDTTVVIGAGGSGDNPTNYTEYVETGTLEYGQSHQFVNGVAQYSPVGNGGRIIPSAPSLSATAPPCFEILTYQLLGGDLVRSETMTLAHNVLNTSNYSVFPSIYYGFTGSAGTYDAAGTSGAIKQIIISLITSTNFVWTLEKDGSDNVNVYLQFLIVYGMSGTDYPKTNS